MLTSYKGFIHLCTEYVFHVWWESWIHKAHLQAVETKTIHIINSLSWTKYPQALRARYKIVAYSIFYDYFHGYCSMNIITPCLSRLAVPVHKTTSILTNHSYFFHAFASIRQYYHSFMPSLVNSRTISIILFLYLITTWIHSRKEY